MICKYQEGTVSGDCFITVLRSATRDQEYRGMLAGSSRQGECAGQLNVIFLIRVTNFYLVVGVRLLRVLRPADLGHFSNPFEHERQCRRTLFEGSGEFVSFLVELSFIGKTKLLRIELHQVAFARNSINIQIRRALIRTVKLDPIAISSLRNLESQTQFNTAELKRPGPIAIDIGILWRLSKDKSNEQRQDKNLSVYRFRHSAPPDSYYPGLETFIHICEKNFESQPTASEKLPYSASLFVKLTHWRE